MENLEALLPDVYIKSWNVKDTGSKVKVYLELRLRKGELREHRPEELKNLFIDADIPIDKIKTKGKCTDIYWKQGKQYRLLFTFGETTYTNQWGQLVAHCRAGAVYRFK